MAKLAIDSASLGDYVTMNAGVHIVWHYIIYNQSRLMQLPINRANTIHANSPLHPYGPAKCRVRHEKMMTAHGAMVIILSHSWRHYVVDLSLRNMAAAGPPPTL